MACPLKLCEIMLNNSVPSYSIVLVADNVAWRREMAFIVRAKGIGINSIAKSNMCLKMRLAHIAIWLGEKV